MRNKIVNLLHVCSVMTPRSFKLFDEPQSSIANTMVKMKREGVVEKSNNTEVFENLSLSNYKENYEEYFFDNIPEEHVSFFEEFGIYDIKRAKYSKKKLRKPSAMWLDEGRIEVIESDDEIAPEEVQTEYRGGCLDIPLPGEYVPESLRMGLYF